MRHTVGVEPVSSYCSRIMALRQLHAGLLLWLQLCASLLAAAQTTGALLNSRSCCAGLYVRQLRQRTTSQAWNASWTTPRLPQNLLVWLKVPFLSLLNTWLQQIMLPSLL